MNKISQGCHNIIHTCISHLETGQKFIRSRIFNRISTGSTKFQPNGCRIDNFVLKNRSRIIQSGFRRRHFLGRIDHLRPFLLRILFRVDLSGWLTQGCYYDAMKLKFSYSFYFDLLWLSASPCSLLKVVKYYVFNNYTTGEKVSRCSIIFAYDGDDDDDDWRLQSRSWALERWTTLFKIS